MADIKDVIVYFCENYPHKAELSKARLTKMVYLADWMSAIQRRKQISNIKWMYNHYGPYVDDVAEVVQKDHLFEMISTVNLYGSTKDVVKLKKNNNNVILTNAERTILDSIIKITAPLYWNRFIELVYSTYPILKSPRYSSLDLVALAGEYGKMEISK